MFQQSSLSGEDSRRPWTFSVSLLLQALLIALAVLIPLLAKPMLPGLNAAITWHSFDSDVAGLDYGDEWNVSIGFRLGQVALLAKYANYRRHGVADFAGDQDTEKFWLQAEVAF